MQVTKHSYLLLFLILMGCYGPYHRKVREKFQMEQAKTIALFQHPIRYDGYYSANYYNDEGCLQDTSIEVIIFKNSNYFIYSSGCIKNLENNLTLMRRYVKTGLSEKYINMGDNYGGLVIDGQKTMIVFYTTTGNDSRHIGVSQGEFKISDQGDTLQVLNGKSTVLYSRNVGNVTYVFHPFDTLSK